MRKMNGPERLKSGQGRNFLAVGEACVGLYSDYSRL